MTLRIKNIVKHLFVLMFVFNCACSSRDFNKEPLTADEIKERDAWIETRYNEYESLYTKIGLKNLTKDFYTYINARKSDTITLQELSKKLDFDSVRVIYSYFPTKVVIKETGLLIDSNSYLDYAPEGRYLYLFQKNKKYFGFVYASTNTLYCSAKSEFSNRDSTLYLMRNFKRDDGSLYFGFDTISRKKN